jgi:ribosomal protein S18
MGHWTGQKYRLKGHKSLTIIAAYRPCRYSPSQSRQATQTVHSQQTTMLKDQGLEDPDPRKIFIDDIIKLIKEQEQDPMNSCILMMDANEAIEDREGSLRKIFNNSNLVDIFSYHTGQTCTIPTYSRETKRIDFILASYNLLSSFLSETQRINKHSM